MKYARKSYLSNQNDYRANQASTTDLLGRLRLFNALATGLSAGLTPAQSISTLRNSGLNRYRRIFDALADELRDGRSVAEAFGRHQLASDFDLAVLKIGERSGTLATVATNISQRYEQTLQNAKRLKNAFIVPLFVGLFALLILPLPDFISGALDPVHYFVLMGVVSLFFYLLWRGCRYGFNRLASTSKTYPAHLFSDLPFIGEFLSDYSRAHFLDRLSLLFSCGYPIIEAVELGHESLVGFARRHRYKQISQDLHNGYGIADTFEHLEILSPEQLPIIFSAEAAGRLDDALLKIAEDAKQTLDAKLNVLVTWLPRFFYALITLGIASRLL